MSQGAGMCNWAFIFYLSTLHVNQISNDLKFPSHTAAVPCALPFLRERWEWAAASHLGNRRRNQTISPLVMGS